MAVAWNKQAVPKENAQLGDLLVAGTAYIVIVVVSLTAGLRVGCNKVTSAQHLKRLYSTNCKNCTDTRRRYHSTAVMLTPPYDADTATSLLAITSPEALALLRRQGLKQLIALD
ncbi:hypothetical protein MRX96_035968 [Rhipicephalus microplus]